MNDDVLTIGGKIFSNRLFTGTGKFADNRLIAGMLESSGSQMITVALRRVDLSAGGDNILDYIPKSVTLLPNTSGARTAAEAVRIARIAREAGCGNFIKIEVITDTKYLMPDNYETLHATEILAKEGFVVLPYVLPDLPLAKRLENAGAAAVMPLGAPIGSNRGLETASAHRPAGRKLPGAGGGRCRHRPALPCGGGHGDGGRRGAGQHGHRHGPGPGGHGPGLWPGGSGGTDGVFGAAGRNECSGPGVVTVDGVFE